jgi:DNA polymerase-3 subunit delta'
MPPRARAPKTDDIPQTDRLEGFPHPRETLTLAGQDIALARAARAIRTGHPPQAWLLTGPPGIGKATLAYRIARYMLAYGATDNGPADLAVAANEPNALQLAANSHPGLLVLKRGISQSTGRLMGELGVDVIRKLGGFFGMTSGAGGWRIAIVDTADDMNDPAANALLKMLEEPPSRAMLLLLSNVPGRLLPTIRSRCQRLDLRPLEPAQVEAELARLLPETPAAERAALARLSGGSIGLALQLSDGDSVTLAREADRLLDGASTPDIAAILGLADRINRITDGLDTFAGFLQQALATRIRAKAVTGAPHLDRWVECLNKLTEHFARTSLLNLDPRQTLLSATASLSHASRRAGTL